VCDSRQNRKRDRFGVTTSRTEAHVSHRLLMASDLGREHRLHDRRHRPGVSVLFFSAVARPIPFRGSTPLHHRRFMPSLPDRITTV
jgi:hypothetical protein